MLHPFPCVIGMISISISNLQRTVAVGDIVGVGVTSTDAVGVTVGVAVGVILRVGVTVLVTVGVIVTVRVTVGVTVGVILYVGVIDGVCVGVADTILSQSIITSLDNALLVQGESNLIVMFFVPSV